MTACPCGCTSRPFGALPAHLPRRIVVVTLKPREQDTEAAS